MRNKSLTLRRTPRDREVTVGSLSSTTHREYLVTYEGPHRWQPSDMMRTGAVLRGNKTGGERAGTEGKERGRKGGRWRDRHI